ncbi:unnamed protein product, partial [Mesorhabditis belari]|uniref:C-type lectin domain-containing protein n=1 Tax=Mesorhabditis belari TaxID=2138241 RepID=A0AAF3F710_9BILA
MIGTGVIAVRLSITIILLFRQISSSIQQSEQLDPSASPNDRDEIRDRRTLNRMGVMAVGLFITILLLFHQISSSIQQSEQLDQFTSPNDRDEIRDRRTLNNKKDCPDTVLLRSCQRNLNQTESKLVEARAKICGLETEIECEQKAGNDEFTKMNSKISQNDDRSTKIGADLKAEIDSKVAEISRTISTKMAQIEANLMGKIAETKRKNDDLEAQLRTQNTEERDGKAKSGELEGKINALQSKNSDLEIQIQFERENKRAEIVKLWADLSSQNTEVRDGKAKIGELEGKINALESKISAFETQINRTITFLDPDGWSYLAKTASWYRVIDQRISFDVAEAYCASRKSHLVSIHSQEEHDFVQKLAKTVDSDHSFWIGLKRNPNKENAFEWTDGNSVDFTNWKVGEPDSNPHAALRSHHGKWVAYSPTYQFRFICKRSSQF